MYNVIIDYIEVVNLMSQYAVRKLKIGNTEQMQSLSRAAGELGSQSITYGNPIQ